EQLPKLSRRAFVQEAIGANCWLILARDLNEAVTITNRLAPEHCEIMTRRPSAVASLIRNAGAIFIGTDSPTVVGDYVAGPSHTLPTGGGGASFAGLTVDQFQRRTSVIEYRLSSLRRALKTVETFAELEGLDAHARSARTRFEH